MKNLIVTLVAGLLLFLTVQTSAHAQAYHPLSACSPSPCFGASYGQWLPSQVNTSYTYFHGGFSDVYANIGTASFGPTYYWDRYLWFSSYNGGDYSYVGFTDNNGTFCSGSGEQLFYALYDNSGPLLASYCFAMSSSDLTDIFTLGVSWYSSGGGGTYFWITDTDNDSLVQCQSPNPCAVASGANGQKWGKMELLEDVYNVWTGTLVPRDHWKNNKYDDQNANIAYWTVDFHTRVHTDPPQFYWATPPASGNNGGDLKSCDIDTGSTC